MHDRVPPLPCALWWPDRPCIHAPLMTRSSLHPARPCKGRTVIHPDLHDTSLHYTSARRLSTQHIDASCFINRTTLLHNFAVKQPPALEARSSRRTLKHSGKRVFEEPVSLLMSEIDLTLPSPWLSGSLHSNCHQASFSGWYCSSGTWQEARLSLEALSC